MEYNRYANISDNQTELVPVENIDIDIQSVVLVDELVGEEKNEESIEHIIDPVEFVKSEVDTRWICTSNNETENNNSNCTTEHNVTVDEEGLNRRINKEGIIRYFGNYNEAGRITTNDGKCYYFNREDIVGYFRYHRAPQKAKFVIDASRPNWAKNIKIIGKIYGQRCYYCLTFGHYTEDCMQLNIDSFNFYYPYM
ncbi:uncharacterized protein LOC126902187 [Daktulosphaira vitifoliae]|uniref:uncharacterized protein LOC126902187 n=1 Tax=Daktulosphaira vitifoliae TaxID=58002 RepID=UPI0021AA99DC|nr:uncharacterized protein LOC126902187 [Daktulosphaira vitifoliae]